MNNSVENNEQISAVSPEEGWRAKDAVLAVTAFAVIIAVAAGAYFFWQARKTEPVEAGSTAPDFTLPFLSGGGATLSDIVVRLLCLTSGPRHALPAGRSFPRWSAFTRTGKQKACRSRCWPSVLIKRERSKLIRLSAISRFRMKRDGCFQ